MPGRDEVQRVLPDRPAAERARSALLRALADAVPVAEDVQGLRVVRHEHHQQGDGAGPGLAHQRPPRSRGVEHRTAEGGEGVQRRRRVHEDARSKRGAADDPPAPARGSRRAHHREGGPHQPREQHRVRPAERRVRVRNRRDGRQQDDGGGDLGAGQLQRDERQRPAARARRTRATGRAAPSRLFDQPSVMCSSQKWKRAAAALGRDDVEDPAERVMRDEERQLLVDVQRRPVDRAPGEEDRDDRGRERSRQPGLRGRRARSDRPAARGQLTGARPSRRACSSGGSGATRYGCSSTTSDSW